MKWIYIVFHILEITLISLIGFVIKDYLPEYMKEKGKNLATKEDIEDITRKTEDVQKEFRENFELFSSDVQFKYDFYFKQYANLYSKIYGIVMQSEYVRHFLKISSEEYWPFEEVPFIELSPIQRSHISIKTESGKSYQIERELESIRTSLSEFNRQQLCDYIIENAEYASQKLLKIAVSYRVAYQLSDGNMNCDEVAKDEELRLIYEMVCCIVFEYNNLRKELNMEYNESEISTHLPTLM